MPTKSSEFEKIIMNSMSPEPISIDILYRNAIANIQLDTHDLEPTTLKGNKTIEPAWKRNLRNVLQKLKDSGKLVNSPKDHWRLPTPNADTALSSTSWNTILYSANEIHSKEITWESPKDGNSYKIIDIKENKIEIERLDAIGNSYLSKKDVERATVAINAAGGIVSRRTLNNIVAKETAFVFFHPDLEWDSNKEHIKVKRSRIIIPTAIVYSDYGEAPNDNVVDLQTFSRKVRKGQKQLRDNLLRIYNQKCCISKTGPENVLQVAHIEAHHINGLNITTNALLLRSDLHDLFDDNLLAIHPKTLLVKIHPDLDKTDYYKFNNTTLEKRNDGELPNEEKLSERWGQIDWLK